MTMKKDKLSILPNLRYWGMANETMRMGIQVHPEIRKIETALYHEAMESMRILNRLDVN